MTSEPDGIEARLARIDAMLLDAEATLSTDLGGQQEMTLARLWRGQVLVDWEPDPHAGGCLLRPALLRRLLALHARAACVGEDMVLEAPGRVVAALSPDHADLVRRLGGARRVVLELRLRFVDGQYRGGQELYDLVERSQRIPLLRVRADVRARAAGPGLPPSAVAPA